MDQDLLSLEQFHRQFDSEEACMERLYQIKWPNGFVCPCCDHRYAYVIGIRRLPLYECRHCRHQTSLTVGTVMEGSSTDLRKWFLAIFLVSCTEYGINAVKLSRDIHVTYKTAWCILHKLRHAMGQADADVLLSGVVRVNVAVHGHPYNPTIHRHEQEHPVFVGSSIDGEGEPAYVKMKLIPAEHTSGLELLRFGERAFAERYVHPQTTDLQFTLRYSPKRCKPLTFLFAKTRKWINDTFHGLGARHLDAYLNEFCYRLNLVIRDEPIFDRLTRLCAQTGSISYAALTHR